MKMKKYFVIIFVICCPLMSIGQVINLGNQREIFVDDYLVEKLDGVRIQMHEPRDEGPVLFFDKPWEGAFSGYVTVIKENDIYRVYYRGVPNAGHDGNESEVTCYAQSKDGIHWEKPDLKIFQKNGSWDNNIILADAAPVTHNFCPFLDTNPQTLPSQKYKAVGGTSKSGLMAYISADGIKWTKLRDESILKKGEFDSQNVVFWSESEKRYLCYFRTWSTGFYKGFRTVSRVTSTDFINWTEPEEMTFGDTPMEHLYTQQTSPYFRAPHIYVAIGGRFLPNRQILNEDQAKQLNVNPNYFKDCSDVFFMTTRGGNKYDRTFMEAFIRPGIGLNNWVSRSNYPALNVHQTAPHEMSVYVNQDYAQPTAHLRRYSLRLDGFTSLSASYRGGEVFTKFFTFSGNELEINYSTSAAGELRFEIQDEKGKAIQGFTMDDSDMIVGNEIERIVSWKGKTNLKDVASKKIRLRIFMKDADLYSIRFKEKRYGLNYGSAKPHERSEAEGAEHLQALLASYTNLQQWETRKKMLRENILHQIQLDPLPQKNPLNPIYGKTRQYKDYAVTNVALETVPGYWLCGSLYQPVNSKGKTPAMLSPHGHFFKTDDFDQHNRFRADQQYRCAMLARMGVTVFSYDMFASGGESSLQIPSDAHGSSFALTIQLWNSIRVTDFLCSLETVDTSKIGITGASGGGTQTFLLAAVDPRITFSVPAVMVSAHFYGGCACESGLPIHQTPCGINTNNVEIAAMIAPRPQLLISIGTDWSKNTPTTELPYLKKIYGFYGSADQVENVHIPNEKHDYGHTKREALYNFVGRVCGLDTQKFKDAQGRYIEKDVNIEPSDNLLVFGDGQIVNGRYVKQPVKTRPMMPASNIYGVDDLKRALKNQQNK